MNGNKLPIFILIPLRSVIYSYSYSYGYTADIYKKSNLLHYQFSVDVSSFLNKYCEFFILISDVY